MQNYTRFNQLILLLIGISASILFFSIQAEACYFDSDSTLVEPYLVDLSSTLVDITTSGHSIVGQTIWRQYTGSSNYEGYIYGIGYSYGCDSDIIQHWWNNGEGEIFLQSADTVWDDANGRYVNIPNIHSGFGTYPMTVRWDDDSWPTNGLNGDGRSDDPYLEKSYILQLWVPLTTNLTIPLMQPGYVMHGHEGAEFEVAGHTFYEPIHNTAYSLEQWLSESDRDVYAWSTGDFDMGIVTSYRENGTLSLSTVYGLNRITISTTSNISFTQPGVYPVIWTFYDLPRGDAGEVYADDPDTYGSITAVVFQVQTLQPGSAPYPIAVYSQKTVIATVTPSEALGGIYQWVQDSGGASGYFIQEHNTDSTAVFVAAQPGDYYFHVEYTKHDDTGNHVTISEPRHFIVFTMDILNLDFIGDNFFYIQCNQTTITRPAWSCASTPTKNEPICYLKNGQLDLNCHFVLSTTLPVAATVYIKADDIGTENLDGLRTASFSAKTSPVWVGTNTALQNNVCLCTASYNWYYSTDSIHWASAGSTGPHKIYVILSTPQAPMATPWTEVLDYACVWANKATAAGYAVDSITHGAYWNFGKVYNKDISHCDTNNVFHLSNFINASYADCQDMSATVQVFSNAVGVDSIGVRRINVPNSGQYFNYKLIRKVGESSPSFGTWSFHQVGWYGGYVYDACLELNLNNPRVPVNEAIDGSYYNDLYDSGDWNLQTPFSYESID